MCIQREEVTIATTADHVVPHRGDPELFWHGELQPLCASCHSSQKQAEERTGIVRGNDTDGWPAWREGE
ncbi:hypothetical protein FJ489_30815 [Mesorhizobium sp. B2-5-12]|nr:MULTISPECIES: hypothetical protein [unclassified Mesorhizobium]TPJ86944.1 hypothetical protein FJ489_30815 [Mesorhizobium sp. B2-5-12]TPK19167.1 hypothetical protein FJ562_31220 [Mesorhizobium sp. B2-5-6]